jgi:RNA polymerase nonessential primary-like sigma factor
MVESNLRLVARIARRYADSGIPLLDLIEEGNLGLIKAIQRFDPYRGIRFSTYAVHWICEHMGQAIRTQRRPVTLPAHLAKSLGKCLRVTGVLSASPDHEPSSGEIAAAMHVPTSRVIQLRQLGKAAVSLDGEDEPGVAERLAAPDAIADLVDGLTEEVLERRLAGWLDRLPERMREVISRRYGLDGREPEKPEGDRRAARCDRVAGAADAD